MPQVMSAIRLKEKGRKRGRKGDKDKMGARKEKKRGRSYGRSLGRFWNAEGGKERKERKERGGLDTRPIAVTASVNQLTMACQQRFRKRMLFALPQSESRIPMAGAFRISTNTV